jgi:hypothetical protein
MFLITPKRTSPEASKNLTCCSTSPGAAPGVKPGVFGRFEAQKAGNGLAYG